MRVSDIIRRAFINLQRNKSRSQRTILSVSIGICAIVVMFSLNIGTSGMLKNGFQDKNELLKIVIKGQYKDNNRDLFSSILKGHSIGILSKEDISDIYHISDNKVSSIYITSNTGRRIGIFDNYTVLTSMNAVNYEALKSFPFKFYKGGPIKDINGAVVSRSFIDRIFITKDYENRKYDQYKTVDVLGKEIVFKVTLGKTGDDGVTKPKDIEIPVRIDGIIEDDNLYFDTISAFDDDESSLDLALRNSVIYLPFERFDKIRDEYNGVPELLQNYQVTFYLKSLDAIDYLIKDLKDKNYSIISKYDDLMFIKYLTFIIKLSLGTLGVLVLLTASIGVINTMLMSVIERTKEIGIIKAIGVKIADIKLIFLTEACLIGLFGGIGGVIGSSILSLIINDKINSLLAQGSVSTKVSVMPYYLVIGGIVFSIVITVISGIPAVRHAVKIDVIHAIKSK